MVTDTATDINKILDCQHNVHLKPFFMYVFSSWADVTEITVSSSLPVWPFSNGRGQVALYTDFLIVFLIEAFLLKTGGHCTRGKLSLQSITVLLRSVMESLLIQQAQVTLDDTWFSSHILTFKTALRELEDMLGSVEEVGWNGLNCTFFTYWANCLSPGESGSFISVIGL